MAWRRTAFSAVFVSALLLRTGVADGSWPSLLAAACLGAVAVAARLRPRARRPRKVIVLAGLGVCGAALATAVHVLAT